MIATILAILFLAADAPADAPDAAGKVISTESVANLLINLLGGGALAGGAWALGRKGSVNATIDGQPLRTKLEEDFATRRELDQLRNDMARENQKLDALMARVLDRMDERDSQLRSAIKETAQSLAASIEKTAKGAGEGRVRIWDAMRELEKDVAAAAAASGVRRVTKAPRGEG